MFVHFNKSIPFTAYESVHSFSLSYNLGLFHTYVTAFELVLRLVFFLSISTTSPSTATPNKSSGSNTGAIRGCFKSCLTSDSKAFTALEARHLRILSLTEVSICRTLRRVLEMNKDGFDFKSVRRALDELVRRSASAGVTTSAEVCWA